MEKKDVELINKIFKIIKPSEGITCENSPITAEEVLYVIKASQPLPEGTVVDFDKNSPHYANNIFMRNADVWTDEHDWVMTKDRFIKLYDSISAPTLPARFTEEQMEDFAEWTECYALIQDKWVNKNEGILIHGSNEYYDSLVKRCGITTSELLKQFIQSLNK